MRKLFLALTLLTVLATGTTKLAAHYHHHNSKFEGIECWTGVDDCADRLGLGWKCRVASTAAVTNEHKGVKGYCREICWNC